MEQFNVYLFGEPRACFASGPFLNFPTEKTLELLAIAALSIGDAVSRERMAAQLRDDASDEQSRRALSTDLWRLRRIFADAGLDSDDYLFANRRAIGFKETAPVYLDVAAFERQVDACLHLEPEAMSQAEARSLAEAAALYSDDLLTTLDRDWCLLLREKLRAKYTALLDRIMRFEMALDAWAESARLGRETGGGRPSPGTCPPCRHAVPVPDGQPWRGDPAIHIVCRDARARTGGGAGRGNATDVPGAACRTNSGRPSRAPANAAPRRPSCGRYPVRTGH